MNDARRKEIEKALGLISEAKSILETARDEEQEYFDNMPENMPVRRERREGLGSGRRAGGGCQFDRGDREQSRNREGIGP